MAASHLTNSPKCAPAPSEPFFWVVYREPATGPRSRGIANRHPAINNKVATKPTPKPNPNPSPNTNP